MALNPRPFVTSTLALVLPFTALVSRSAQATDFFEYRGTAAGQVGRDRASVDLGLGAAADLYVDSDKGVRAGGDLVLGSYPGSSNAVPGTLALAPDLAVSFGKDGATRRWFAVWRPMTFRLLNLRNGGVQAVPLRTELGLEHELRAADGGLRFRVGLFYAPGAAFDDAHFEWLAASLRLTLAWAKPPEGPPKGHPLPGE